MRGEVDPSRGGASVCVWLVLAGDCLVGSCPPRLSLALVCASVCLCLPRPAPCSLSLSTPPPSICPTPLHIVSTPHECHGAMGDVRASCCRASSPFTVDAAAAASLSLLLLRSAAADICCVECVSATDLLTSRMSIVCAISYQVVVLPHGGIRAVEPAPLQ